MGFLVNHASAVTANIPLGSPIFHGRLNLIPVFIAGIKSIIIPIITANAVPRVRVGFVVGDKLLPFIGYCFHGYSVSREQNQCKQAGRRFAGCSLDRTRIWWCRSPNQGVPILNSSGGGFRQGFCRRRSFYLRSLCAARSAFTMSSPRFRPRAEVIRSMVSKVGMRILRST